MSNSQPIGDVVIQDGVKSNVKRDPSSGTSTAAAMTLSITASEHPSRRDFLRAASLGIGALTLGVVGNPGKAGALGAPTGPTRPRVAVLGGGVAGLTAAHELAERGYHVDVFERRALGGKARSIPVPGTGTGGRLPLPGEHSWRSFFGFYNNLPDTLRRIPLSGTTKSSYDNLVAANILSLARAGGARTSISPRRWTSNLCRSRRSLPCEM